MEREKLFKLVSDKNEQRERNMLSTASDLIEQIAKQQAIKRQADETIEECRKELRELKVDEMNFTDLIGE